jgi:mono/diheme cytochrome c family protein
VRIRRLFLILPLLFLVWLPGAVLPAAAQASSESQFSSGQQVYEAACVACHARDGRGQPQTTVGFELPLPDFSDCNFASREPAPDWGAIVHEGGPARGFSEIMPAFGDALSSSEIQMAVEYVRGFCADKAWPRGDLNLPRALVTEKAFPEDEAVLTTTVDAEGSGAFSNQLVYEKRFGARNQIEVAVPFHFQKPEAGSWNGGIGDVALGFKRTLFHSIGSGSIFSVAGEAVLPTGNKARDLGKGVTIFEPFAAFGQILPRDSFLQFQSGIELPTHSDDATKEVFWRATAGKSFAQQGGFGRAWTPMVELLGARELEDGAEADWDLVPEMQVTLSTRQHIMFNFGVRIPMNHRGPRATQVLFYFLWDWFDGGLRDGW